MSRTGIGFDAHRFGGAGPLMLGCYEVTSDNGLAGHSDGDVLAHAIADALLGAAGLGDIGERFPATPEWEGARGSRILGEVVTLLGAARITGVDATVICEEPRLAPHRDGMRKALARALGIDESAVSVKATTTDGMGFTGRGDGIAAMAVATIEDGR